MSEKQHPGPVPPFSLPVEGRLLAHRRLLVELLRALPDNRKVEMMEWMDERALYRHRLDAPVIDNGEIELELARADEFQILKRMTKSNG